MSDDPGTPPDDWMEVGRIEIIKFLDQDGAPRVAMHYDRGLNSWEAVGLMTDYINEIITKKRIRQ